MKCQQHEEVVTLSLTAIDEADEALIKECVLHMEENSYPECDFYRVNLLYCFHLHVCSPIVRVADTTPEHVFIILVLDNDQLDTHLLYFTIRLL